MTARPLTQCRPVRLDRLRRRATPLSGRRVFPRDAITGPDPVLLARQLDRVARAYPGRQLDAVLRDDPHTALQVALSWRPARVWQP